MSIIFYNDILGSNEDITYLAFEGPVSRDKNPSQGWKAQFFDKIQK